MPPTQDPSPPLTRAPGSGAHTSHGSAISKPQQTPRIPSASVPEQDVDQGRAGVQHGQGQPTGIPTATMPRHLPGSQLHTRTCNGHTHPWAGLVGSPPRPQWPKAPLCVGPHSCQHKVTPPHRTGANHKGTHQKAVTEFELSCGGLTTRPGRLGLLVLRARGHWPPRCPVRGGG